MLCSEGPSLRLADRVFAMSDLEKNLDFSCIYERKAQFELASEEISVAKDTECKCLVRPQESKHEKYICHMHKDFFPSLEAINEEQGENDASSVVAELGMKYDLTLPDRHYHQAKNMGYLQHRKGRHYRRKAFGKDNDFPRRERSVTF